MECECVDLPYPLQEEKLREGRGADAGHWLAREHGLASPAIAHIVSEAGDGAHTVPPHRCASSYLCSFRAELQLLLPRLPAAHAAPVRLDTDISESAC